MQKILLMAVLLLQLSSYGQTKKPLDHSVYDGWKSVIEKMISNDGKFVVYTVVPQEGDAELVIQEPRNAYRKVIKRGYGAVITDDSRFLICKIKPIFQDTRQARIKKKKPDEMPKDSMSIIELGKDSVVKFARVKSFKTPEKAGGWVAAQFEKPLPDTTKKKPVVDSVKKQIDLLVKLADSVIRKSIDSVKGKVDKEEVILAAQKAAKEILKKAADAPLPVQDAEGDDAAGAAAAEGTDLLLRNLADGKEKTFKLVSDYLFDKKGNRLLLEITKNPKDSNSKALVLLYQLASGKTDTLMKGFNDARNYAFDESGNQLAFVAERDSSEKALQKFYKLWYYSGKSDTAVVIADRKSDGVKNGYTISENASISFSKNAAKLYFGVGVIRAPKDTNLVDFELARLDVWNYKDDYLQTQQLKNLDAELKRSYLSVINISDNKLVQLGDSSVENITWVNEGNADWALGETDRSNRIEAQWTGRSKRSAFIISTKDGSRKLIKENLLANYSPSPAGKYVYWYDLAARNYFTYEVAGGIIRTVSDKVKVPLYDEENDVPDHPSPYGVMGWLNGDSALFVYDRFDYWKLDPAAVSAPEVYSQTLHAAPGVTYDNGRQLKQTFRFIPLDKEERYFTTGKKYLVQVFNETTKESALQFRTMGDPKSFSLVDFGGKATTQRHTMSKNGASFIYSQENYVQCPDLHFIDLASSDNLVPVYNAYGQTGWKAFRTISKLSDINPQQKEYNWGTAELFKWKAYNGKMSEGIIYKPEGFDPKKKYPLIAYFYEKLSDGLYQYQSPAPTPSRLNISFFVSRGYVVFAPDITYSTGHPGKDAYDHIVSGVRAIVQKGFVDSTRMGIQGQSWGGYQVAYLITATKLFAAAWAGAPVANMTSAYGGIRWESGLNRQFQYEHQQSRIGSDLWKSLNLYIENSPLFHFNKVVTPVVLMSNDNDGAVPWYQGIEMFTALRRLGKPVWMLNYNGEAHNLLERKNRKDIQVREQQFFDWKLKGEKPAKWLIKGVPATEKGRDWGLGTD